MAAIGSYTFIKATGPKITEPTVEIEIINRPNIDGIGWRDKAVEPHEVVWQTIEKVTDVSTANARPPLYEALKGTKVTVVDDNGRSVADVLILDVTVFRIQQIPYSTDPSNTAMVFASWRMIVPQVPV